MEKHPSVTGWQELFSSFSAAVAIATFDIYRLPSSKYTLSARANKFFQKR